MLGVNHVVATISSKDTPEKILYTYDADLSLKSMMVIGAEKLTPYSPSSVSIFAIILFVLLLLGIFWYRRRTSVHIVIVCLCF